MKHGWIPLVFALGLFIGCSAHADETLTLDRCIDIAVQNATSVLQTRNQAHLAGVQVLQAYGQFLPNLMGAASYGYQSGSTLYTIEGQALVGSRGQNAAFTISSTLNLFNGLADYSGLKSALARRDSVEASLEWAKSSVALDAAQAFLQVVLDQQLLGIARKNVVASQARLRLLKGQARVGSSSIPDLYRQEAQTSSDEFAVTSNETKFRTDLVLLVRKLRIDPAVSYRVEIPPLDPKPLPLADQTADELASRAIDARADIRSNALLADSTHWDITHARAGYWPQLNLLFSRSAAGALLSQLSVNGQDFLNFNQPNLGAQLGNQVDYSLSLNLTWTLFDRFQTTLAVAEAQTDHENAKINLTDSKLQAQADIRTALITYQSARNQIDTARAGLDSAQKSYEAVDGMYSLGSASIVDVLTSQAALVLARSDLAQALTNLKLQEKSLEYATGKILHEGSVLPSADSNKIVHYNNLNRLIVKSGR